MLAIGVVIPGLSSSFLLVYLGLYKSILFAIAEIYIPTLFFAGVGFVIAAALLIFLMHYVLVRFHRISYFAILGIAVGSMLLIVPNIVQGFSWLCIPLFLAGSALGLLQSLHEIRKNRAEAEKNADPQETDETQKATSVESDTTV